VWELMAGDTAAEDAAFLDCWFAPETHERIVGIASRLGA
jgi:hypothetical protein